MVLGAVSAGSSWQYGQLTRANEHCPPPHRCPSICKGPTEVSRQESNSKMPECPPGVGMIWDKCNCCRKCAKQTGDRCDMMNPCDSTKGLTCQLNSEKKVYECQPKPGGKTCFVQGREYANGEEFKPSQSSCKFTCICVNGDIGCYPTCRTKPLSSCINPRHCKPKKGECCGEWTCGNNGHRKECEAGGQVADPIPFQPAYREEDIQAHIRQTDNCYVQTTAWSPCSRDCGWGIRERISNNNTECEMQKETKLCQTRPCDYDNELNTILESNRFKNKLCARAVRPQSPVKFTFSGCESKRLYKPRYCGKCKDKKCCTPDETETIEVDFYCPKDKQQFRKQMDDIKTCKCNYQCDSNSMDIFSSVKLLRDDLHRG